MHDIQVNEMQNAIWQNFQSEVWGPLGFFETLLQIFQGLSFFNQEFDWEPIFSIIS